MAPQEVRAAVLAMLRALPGLAAADVAALSPRLPRLLRLADLPPETLTPLLRQYLASGSVPLLRVVLSLGERAPSLFLGWPEGGLEDSVLALANAPPPPPLGATPDPELPAVALGWLGRQHAAAAHDGAPSPLLPRWRQLLPGPREPAQVLALRVKALAACLAGGAGEPWEVVSAVAAWAGFWGVEPSKLELRALRYALRTLGVACAGPGGAATSACLVAAVLQVGRGGALACIFGGLDHAYCPCLTA